MKNERVKMIGLLVLLGACLCLAFLYPLLVASYETDLASLAILMGFFGSVITFFCILAKALESEKSGCDCDSQNNPSNTSKTCAGDDE